MEVIALLRNACLPADILAAGTVIGLLQNERDLPLLNLDFFMALPCFACQAHYEKIPTSNSPDR